MYNIKEMWVPAYFRSIYMGGLFRTTSRSVSEKNFFNFFVNTLVEKNVSAACHLLRFSVTRSI